MSLATNLAQIPNITVNRIPRATATGFANSAIFDNGTNVGIGTSSPLTILHLNSNGAFSTSGNMTTGFVISNGATGRALNMGTFDSGGYSWIQAAYVNNADVTFPLALQPRGGNVGIGTSSPGYKLDVQNSGDFDIRLRDNTLGGTVGLLFETANDFSGTSQAYIKGIGSGNSGLSDLIFGTAGTSGATSATERMRITSGGNVGIGTSSPSFRLSVANEMIVGAQGGTDYLYMAGGSGFGAKLRAFYAGGSLNSEISGNGNTLLNLVVGRVGIGTSSPNHTLDVNGNINIPGGNQIVFNNEESVWGIRARTCASTTSLGAALKNIIYCGGGANEGFAVIGSGYNAALEVRNDGTVWVRGALSKGSGSFRIDHPLKSMKDTHNLVHSFVESPQANNIYRGKVQLVNGKAQVNLDDVSTMTDGTFVALNRDIHAYTTNESDWDAVRGKVIGNILYIESENNESSAIVSWLVIGERQDQHMMETDWTDKNGKVIVEPLKLKTH